MYLDSTEAHTGFSLLSAVRNATRDLLREDATRSEELPGLLLANLFVEEGVSLKKSVCMTPFEHWEL